MLRLKLFFVMLFLISSGCANDSTGKAVTVFKEIPELREIKPEKPVKIKLKRNAKGLYSWDLNGNNAEKVIQADKKLREALKEASDTD